MELHGCGQAAGQAVLAVRLQVQGEVQRKVLRVVAVSRGRILCPDLKKEIEVKRSASQTTRKVPIF